MIRGDVHPINFSRSEGRVQRGPRYGVVVQADALALSTVVICPTSQSTPLASFHPKIDLEGEETKVMCEMARVVDARKLGNRVTHLSLDEIRAVDDALKLVFDLPG